MLREHELANMKYTLRKFSLIHLLLLSFHCSCVRKSVLYSKNIQYAYNFYGTDLYINVCRGIFRTHSNVYGGASLQKSQGRFTVDIQLGCKYVSGIGFKVEKVYRLSTFI